MTMSGSGTFGAGGAYGLLASIFPFSALEAMAVLPERLAGYQPVLDRLLAKKPEDRFQSARELFGLIAI